MGVSVEEQRQRETTTIKTTNLCVCMFAWKTAIKNYKKKKNKENKKIAKTTK